MGNQIKLQKIPLKRFLEALTEIYETGAEFIDIIGIPNTDQDTIGLAVKDEYMLENIKEDIPIIEKKEKPVLEKKVKLSEQDIKNLSEN